MGNLNYDSQKEYDKHGLESERTPIPAGEYPVVITASDVSVNKNNTGRVMRLDYEIIDGPMKGNTVLEFINIEHENEKTQEIAKKAFNSVLDAVGKLGHRIGDTSEIHNIPMMIKVTYKEGDQYPNSVKKHMKIGGESNSRPSSTPAQTSAPASSGGANKPWMKQNKNTFMQ